MCERERASELLPSMHRRGEKSPLWGTLQDGRALVSVHVYTGKAPLTGFVICKGRYRGYSKLRRHTFIGPYGGSPPRSIGPSWGRCVSLNSSHPCPGQDSQRANNRLTSGVTSLLQWAEAPKTLFRPLKRGRDPANDWFAPSLSGQGWEFEGNSNSHGVRPVHQIISSGFGPVSGQ